MLVPETMTPACNIRDLRIIQYRVGQKLHLAIIVIILSTHNWFS